MQLFLPVTCPICDLRLFPNDDIITFQLECISSTLHYYKITIYADQVYEFLRIDSSIILNSFSNKHFKFEAKINDTYFVLNKRTKPESIKHLLVIS